MKIALIHPLFYPTLGGVEVYLHQLQKELSKLGHEVHVVTSDPFYRTHKNPNIHFLPSHTLLRYDLPDKKMLFHILKEINPDIIHVNNPLPYATTTAIRAQKLKIPVVSTYHANANPTNPIVKVGVWGEKQLYRHLFKRLIVTSPHYQKIATKFFPHDKIDVIPLGIDNEILRNGTATKKEDARKKFGIKPHEKMILFVGGMDQNHYYKGIPELLQTAQMLPNVTFTLIGDGDRRKQYESMAKKLKLNNVIFTGRKESHHLLQYYRAADALMLPSTSSSEGYGMVLLEAMACGSPVITTSAVGSQEAITAAQAGVIVPPRNPVALKDGIVTLLSDERLRNRIIKNGFTFTRDLTWKNTARQTLKTYEHALA